MKFFRIAARIAARIAVRSAAGFTTVLLFALATSAHAADNKPLRVGLDPTYEPFEYKLPDGKLVGFEVDIARALCAQLKRECVFIDQSWEGIIPSLLARKYDVIIPCR